MATLNWWRWFPSKQDERIGLLVCWALTGVALLLMFVFSWLETKQLISLVFWRMLVLFMLPLCVTLYEHIVFVGEERNIPHPYRIAFLAGFGLILIYGVILVQNDPQLREIIWR